MSNGRVDFIGCPVDALTMSETLSRIEAFIRVRSPRRHVALNAAKFVQMAKEPGLFEAVSTADMVSADGQSIVWAARFLGRPLPERVAGIDLMEKLVELSAAKGYRVFLFGSKQEVLERAVAHYLSKYPRLQLAGYRNGYFQPSDDTHIVAQIRDARPDILFVAFSSPKKEYWVRDHLPELGVPFCMGVGGSLDVVVGDVKRAPRWAQRSGLEWLYRFLQEPRRMWRRYLVGNVAFAWLVLKARMGWLRSIA